VVIVKHPCKGVLHFSDVDNEVAGRKGREVEGVNGVVQPYEIHMKSLWPPYEIRMKQY